MRHVVFAVGRRAEFRTWRVCLESLYSLFNHRRQRR